jgi:hypothetical protein
MSKLRSTYLRHTRPTRRNSSVPKLQCGGYRSEKLYVTSPSTRATKTKFRGKKRYETTVILIDDCEVPTTSRKLKKWTDDLTDAQNWLIRQLGAFPGGTGISRPFSITRKRNPCLRTSALAKLLQMNHDHGESKEL